MRDVTPASSNIIADPDLQPLRRLMIVTAQQLRRLGMARDAEQAK
jgi:hypothetical protein